MAENSGAGALLLYRRNLAKVIMTLESLSEAAVAELLGVSTETLQSWRLRNGGPPYVRVRTKAGGRYRYPADGVHRFITANLVLPSSPGPGAGK
jgi:hypothetical protein